MHKFEKDINKFIKSFTASVIAFLFVIVFVFNSQCTGEENAFKLFPPDSSKIKNTHATLNGHKFIINSAIGSPFIETYLQNRLGAGQTVDFRIPPVTIDTQNVVQLRGDLVYTTIGVDYQQEIKDWMAFNIGFTLFGRLGTQTGALISQGVNVTTEFELGWLFKLYQSRKFALSGSLDLINTNYTLVDLQSFVENAIDSGAIVQSNKLVNNVPIVKAGGTLTCAYAFNRVFGFTGNFNLHYGESADRQSEDIWYVEYGGAFDADLMPTKNIPIGFLLGFYHNNIPIANEEIVNQPNNLLAQINYTGKPDLNLGLEISYLSYRPSDFSNNIKFINMSMNFRYFF